MFPLLLDFAALPPEVNSARLCSGPGPAPLQATAAAYMAMANGLNAAAAGSDGSMSQMAGAWGGPSADRAQEAFRTHADWLRTQAAAAAATATVANQIAAANAAALATMPKLPEILAVQAAHATAIATNVMAQNTPTIFALEATYLSLAAIATTTMFVYAATATGLLSQLPPPAAAPPIVSGGLGQPPDVTALVPADGLGAGDPRINLSGSTGSGTGYGPVGSAPAPAPGGTAASGTGGQPGNTGQPGGAGGQPKPPAIEQPVPDIPAMSADSNEGITQLPTSEGGLLGTSPSSPTLAGLNGGVGSLVTLGMMTGGLGAMPSGAARFRMPSSWSAMPPKTFGMSAGASATQPVAQRTSSRGVSAPQARQRRREKDERRPEKVFVPGAPSDVPVLEVPHALVANGYINSESEQDSASEQILGYQNPDAGPGTNSPELLESNTPIRPR
ncbi:PPE family protein [Nocardia sp. NPDC058058]|uniref:PPE family protein n=1 Tax=Nocardia sp. NPDC058058 TaxID=3346317 RepID=UPI0036DA7CFC